MSSAAAAASSAASSANALPASAVDNNNLNAAHPAASIHTAITHTNTLLHLFTQLSDVRTLYTDATGRYLTATKDLKAARLSLDKFMTACNRGKHLTLPRSMQMHLIERAKLPIVADDTHFNDATTATLRSIEETATKATYDALVIAKMKHIAHLEQRANAHAFIITAVNSHRAYVSKYAAQMDASLTFPAEAAVHHFEQYLRQRVQELNLQSVSNAMREQSEAATALAEDNKAQESVLAGASTGVTISKLAKRAVLHELQQRGAISTSHQHGKRQRDQSTTSSPTADDTRVQHGTHPREQPATQHGQRRVSFHDRTDSEQKRHKPNAGNASEQTSTTPATHAPGRFVLKLQHNPISDEQQPRHANSQPRQHEAASRDSSAHRSHGQRNRTPKSVQTNTKGGGPANARSSAPTPRQHQPAAKSRGQAKQHQGNHGRGSGGN